MYRFFKAKVESRIEPTEEKITVSQTFLADV